MNRCLTIPVGLTLFLFATFAAQAQVCTVDQYSLPADIPVPNSQATASTFQEFSWNSFLGLNAPEVGAIADPTGDQPPQWSKWSSTVDMLSCTVSPSSAGCDCPNGNCKNSGARYYPTACRRIPKFKQYRVLDQVGKVDDTFEEAKTRGVSNNPVIDRFGNFLRYEILISPSTYTNVVEEDLYDQANLFSQTEDINMQCGSPEYTGGDPANPDMGAMVLKLAWMDVQGPVASNSLDLSTYHTEDLLVYTPSYRNSTGVESCEVRKMAMVGMHIEHKTLNQPNWIWSTFEHIDNAPSCTKLLPGPNTGVTNTNCPLSVSDSYNFFGMECNNNPACAECNTGPASNAPEDACKNPTADPKVAGWCLDLGPAAVKGKSRLCRQVPVLDDPFAPLPNPLPDDYPQAALWNHTCLTALTEDGPNVWANYMLISGQWLKGSALPPPPPPPALPSCVNVALAVAPNLRTDPDGKPINDTVILPQVHIQGGAMKPFLGNTSMESYDRANCAGCHAKAIVKNDKGAILSTDFMYWLSLEVGAPKTNFLSYRIEYVNSQCLEAGARMEATFLLTGALQNSFIADQEFDLVVAIQIPEEVGDPELATNEVHDPTEVWMLNGAPVLFEVDPDCAADSCEVDAVFPPESGMRWVQFRTVNPVSITSNDSNFAGILTYEFPGDSCPPLSENIFQVWVSDSSQQQLGNFVDGDIQSGVFTMFLGIPTLGPMGLGALILLLMISGIYLVPRFRGA